MELKPLICTQCGGQIDRKTLICHHCNTAYEVEHGETLIVKEIDPNEVILGASISIDPRDLNYHKEDILKWGVEELAHQLGQQLIPLMEVKTDVDLNHQMVVLYGRVKAAKAKGNLYEVLNKNLSLRSINREKYGYYKA